MAFAERVCGAINSAGVTRTVDASGELSAEVRRIIARAIGAQGGATGRAQVRQETYENVARQDLGQELFSVRQCRERMTMAGSKEFFRRTVTFLRCTRPEFGRTGWENSEEITQSSGWRGGGSNPQNWCNELIAGTVSGRRIGPTHQAEILNMSEGARWTGWHGRDRQYNYSCTVRLSWGPKYAERQDPRCGAAAE